MKKIFYIIINPFRRLYWFIAQPNTRGVKGVLIHGDSVLMIRNSYVQNKHWTFPGGRIKRGEDAHEAVQREVREEVGILNEQFHFLYTYKNRREYKRDTVYVFTSTAKNDNFKIDHAEILEAQWFHIRSLPENISPSIPQYITLLKNRIDEKNDAKRHPRP